MPSKKEEQGKIHAMHFPIIYPSTPQCCCSYIRLLLEGHVRHSRYSVLHLVRFHRSVRLVLWSFNFKFHFSFLIAKDVSFQGFVGSLKIIVDEDFVVEPFDFGLCEFSFGDLESFLDLILGVGSSLDQTLLKFLGVWWREEYETGAVVVVFELLNTLK